MLTKMISVLQYLMNHGNNNRELNLIDESGQIGGLIEEL